MDIAGKLVALHAKDTAEAFASLKELEMLSDNSDTLYPYIDQFIAMADSDKYFVRVRGFRLLCKQAKWDVNNIINRDIDKVLGILNDDKPTAVRQALAALKDVVLHKKELRDLIKSRVLEIDYLRYKDTMHGLISKDIQALLELMIRE